MQFEGALGVILCQASLAVQSGRTFWFALRYTGEFLTPIN